MPRRYLPYDPRLKEVARKLRRDMTLAERMVWRRLRAKAMCGYGFDRQQPIAKWIVDFFCLDLMLAVEVDGWTHDAKGRQDVGRQRALERMGVKFLRFTDKEVLANIQHVLDTIENWIRANEGTERKGAICSRQQRHPPPTPAGGGGQSVFAPPSSGGGRGRVPFARALSQPTGKITG